MCDLPPTMFPSCMNETVGMTRGRRKMESDIELDMFESMIEIRHEYDIRFRVCRREGHVI